MTFREWVADHLGGLLPYVPKPEREVHIMDGATYTIELVWFRSRFTLQYHSPRKPISVRLAEAEAIAHQIIDRHDAGEPIVQPGDVIPTRFNFVPYQVQRCRDGQGDEWRRTVTEEERYTTLDDGLPAERRQAYDWVNVYVDREGIEHISGHGTDEGVLTHRPVTVLEIRQDVPA